MELPPLLRRAVDRTLSGMPLNVRSTARRSRGGNSIGHLGQERKGARISGVDTGALSLWPRLQLGSLVNEIQLYPSHKFGTLAHKAGRHKGSVCRKLQHMLVAAQNVS